MNDVCVRCQSIDIHSNLAIRSPNTIVNALTINFRTSQWHSIWPAWHSALFFIRALKCPDHILFLPNIYRLSHNWRGQNLHQKHWRKCTKFCNGISLQRKPLRQAVTLTFLICQTVATCTLCYRVFQTKTLNMPISNYTWIQNEMADTMAYSFTIHVVTECCLVVWHA